MENKLPDNAIFRVPDVDTVFWDQNSWYKWWQMCGGRTLTQAKAEMLEIKKEFYKKYGMDYTE